MPVIVNSCEYNSGLKRHLTFDVDSNFGFSTFVDLAVNWYH